MSLPIDRGSLHNAVATLRGSPRSTDGGERRCQIIRDRRV